MIMEKFIRFLCDPRIVDVSERVPKITKSPNPAKLENRARRPIYHMFQTKDITPPLAQAKVCPGIWFLEGLKHITEVGMSPKPLRSTLRGHGG